MASKRKIIIMSKLAIYEKHDALKDIRKGSYYRHDFVYKRNFGLRFFALIGAVILALLYVMYRFAIDQVDIFELDIPQEIKTIILLVGGILIIYSLIGTIKYNIDYEAANKRLKRYNSLLNLLDREEEPKPAGKR